MGKDFRNGFSTLSAEVNLDELPVEGVIPIWLSGILLRNGPAQFEVGNKKLRHWFDGHAMLHRFSFKDGCVAYANKFIQSNTRKLSMEKNTVTCAEFATDPCHGILKRFFQLFKGAPPGNNANVNITKIAGEFLALTETPLPVAFDADNLKTTGVVNFSDDIGFVSSTAHPHLDTEKERCIQHLIRYGRKSSYHFVKISNNKPFKREIISIIKVSEPAYVHSFSVTENYLILVEPPLVVNPLKLLFRKKPFIENFEWKPDKGTRFFIIEKKSGKLVKKYKVEAFFFFHHVNAFEKDGDIILDIICYEDARILKQFYLDSLYAKDGGSLSSPELRRYKVSLDSLQASFEKIPNVSIEFPRINYHYNGIEYRYVYGVSESPKKKNDFINALIKIDIQNRKSCYWYEEGKYPGEPVFVMSSDSSVEEDDGVILSVVLDAYANSSFLLVLDAKTFEELGRALIPHAIPFGLHGQYFRESSKRIK